MRIVTLEPDPGGGRQTSRRRSATAAAAAKPMTHAVNTAAPEPTPRRELESVIVVKEAPAFEGRYFSASAAWRPLVRGLSEGACQRAFVWVVPE